ncbi:Hypothetical predicted protein [Prunus dulcis]|uniref:Uncharacterized protein n=1 Tax=Prunus dulcis TaxID=3755 RepID=A0A5E4FYB8_PRUDU|nr:Hypothetical predicted protein [Prunus dulcis]
MEFINNILINVVVLDSRYKLEYVSFYFSDVYNVGVNNEKVSGGQPSKGVAISSVIVVPKGNNDHYQSARLARVAQIREHKEILDREVFDVQISTVASESLICAHS